MVCTHCGRHDFVVTQEMCGCGARMTLSESPIMPMQHVTQPMPVVPGAVIASENHDMQQPIWLRGDLLTTYQTSPYRGAAAEPVGAPPPPPSASLHESRLPLNLQQRIAVLLLLSAILYLMVEFTRLHPWVAIAGQQLALASAHSTTPGRAVAPATGRQASPTATSAGQQIDQRSVPAQRDKPADKVAAQSIPVNGSLAQQLVRVSSSPPPDRNTAGLQGSSGNYADEQQSKQHLPQPSQGSGNTRRQEQRATQSPQSTQGDDQNDGD